MSYGRAALVSITATCLIIFLLAITNITPPILISVGVIFLGEVFGMLTTYLVVERWKIIDYPNPQFKSTVERRGFLLSYIFAFALHPNRLLLLVFWGAVYFVVALIASVVREASFSKIDYMDFISYIILAIGVMTALLIFNNVIWTACKRKRAK